MRITVHRGDITTDADDCSTVAIPAISTGIYGYPSDLATDLAIGTIRATLARVENVNAVHLWAFDADTESRLKRAVEVSLA